MSLPPTIQAGNDESNGGDGEMQGLESAQGLPHDPVNSNPDHGISYPNIGVAQEEHPQNASHNPVMPSENPAVSTQPASLPDSNAHSPMGQPRAHGSAEATSSMFIGRTVPEIIKLLDYYQDESKWEGDDDDNDESETDEDEDEDEIDLELDDEVSADEDEKPQGSARQQLFYAERIMLLKLIADPPSDAPKDILQRVQQWMPYGFQMNSKQLRTVIHPDTFQETKDKDLATEAIAIVQSYLDDHPDAVIQGEHQGGIDVDFVMPYHEAYYKEATPAIIKMYNAYSKGKSTESYRQKIEEINEKIIKSNVASKNGKNFGLIDTDTFKQLWNPRHGDARFALCWSLCEQRHYPLGWAEFPPQDIQLYDQDRGAYWKEARDLLHEHFETLWNTSVETFQDKPSTAQHLITIQTNYNYKIQSLNEKSKRPKMLNKVDVIDLAARYIGLKIFSTKGMIGHCKSLQSHLRKALAANSLPTDWLPMPEIEEKAKESLNSTDEKEDSNISLHIEQLSGSEVVISTKPRTIKFKIRPGYTYTGERIIALQKIGNAGARYVVESDNKLRRIIDSGRAGGKLVLDAAKNEHVPYTTTSYKDIEKIKSAMLQGRPWDITYVAFANWDLSRHTVKGDIKLPLSVHGLKISGREHHVSRSVLSNLIGQKAALNMAVRGINGNINEGLPQTLMSQLPGCLPPKRLTDRPNVVSDNKEHATQQDDKDNMQLMISMMAKLLASQNKGS